jgi:hypothetical protein
LLERLFSLLLGIMGIEDGIHYELSGDAFGNAAA